MFKIFFEHRYVSHIGSLKSGLTLHHRYVGHVVHGYTNHLFVECPNRIAAGTFLKNTGLAPSLLMIVAEIGIDPCGNRPSTFIDT